MIIRRTAIPTAAVLVGLLVILAWVRVPERWPEAEQPPRQGEAVASQEGRPPVHSAAALARLIREPQNTWSNLAFVAGGAYLAAVGRLRVARATGLALIAVGIGSFLYHASASRTLRHLDVGAMYWLFLLAAGLSVGSAVMPVRRRLEAKVGWLVAGTLVLAVALTAGRNLVVGGVKPLALHVATAITATLMIGAMTHVTWVARSWRVVGEAAFVLVAFAVAITCQVGDRPGGWLFDPARNIQPHAVWHVASAVAFVGAVRLLDARESREARSK